VAFLIARPFLAITGEGAGGAIDVTPAQVDGAAGVVPFTRSVSFVGRNIWLKFRI
jgi:hypothetical protein